MVLYYNVAQPQNIKDSYQPFDQIDFLVKIPAGREIEQNSFRISGTLKATVVSNGGTNPSTQPRPVTADDAVFFNQYAGVHSCFRSFTTSVSDRTIENIAYYPRWVVMKSQAYDTQIDFCSNSETITELKGLGIQNIIAGTAGTNNQTDGRGVSFSFKPTIAINKSDQNLSQTKFPQIRIMGQLASVYEALYTTIPTVTTSISYTISDLQLSWYEHNQQYDGEVVLNTCYLNKQSIVSNHTNLNIFCPNVYDAISISFISQANINNIATDNNACYLIPQINRVEFMLNGQNAPMVYPLTSYQDYVLNYKKSLMAKDGNSFNKGLLSLGQVFGIGCLFNTSINDKIGVVLDIDDSLVTINNDPYDAFIYVNGYVTM